MAISKAPREDTTTEGKPRTDGDVVQTPPLILELVLGLNDPVAAFTE
jgi:hypothetical protein